MEYAWIASKDDEALAVLTSAAFNVRPPGEVVPKALQGTPLGAIFERLVRTNDGDRHASLRPRVEHQLSRWSLDDVRATAEHAAAHVAPQDVAGYTIATLVGLRDPQEALPLIRDFAAAIAAALAGGTDTQAITRGNTAVQPLIAALPAYDNFDDAANALGFFFQSYAATARLIENMLTGRTDPPALFTRRYAVEDTDVCGTHVRRGDAVVILLTSPALNFGAGRHACPGQRIAQTIAQAAVPVILVQQQEPELMRQSL